ncbi:glucosaminidase domain-containing protein [Chryseolinea sp. T2]|uniref:glucosaminidase domain-containing protein n=1 Tax=Chryseolinea sp. T2 TaxID=3129255 RepID=UPI003076BE3C
MSIKDYISRFRGFIKARLRTTGILPSVVMAHAIYESADETANAGEGVHASVYNNDTRMRADSKWKGPKVRLPIRTISPKAKGRMAWFRVYVTGEQSVADRIDMLLSKRKSWPTMLFYDDTLKMQSEILQAAVVSNDPRYGERIVQIVNKHKLYWMDTRWILEYVLRTVVTISLVRLCIYLLGFWDQIVPWR